MAAEVLVPKLGMNTECARIIRWHRREGEPIAVGEVLAEIETDKANFELEAEAGGVVRKLLAAEGEEVAINQVIAVIAGPDEDISELLARAASGGPAQGSAHLEQAYRSLRDTPGRPEGGRRLDPNALRERLGRRGLVEPGRRDRRRVAIYGAGLGAKQLLEVTRQLANVEVIGLIDDNPALAGSQVAGLPVLGGYDRLVELWKDRALDAVALSFHSEVRRRIHRRLRAETDIEITALVDPRAIIGSDVQVGPGALIEAGAVVGPGTTVGEGVIVDMGAVVAHDCRLGPFSHLSPGCHLSGVVNLLENVLVGAGASINSTVTVGRNVIITPGAAVMNDVPDDVIVGGVPAKILGKSRRGEYS
jgi:sugar O-acyltransferase (sialic acid O-acetyltransferase NeuD family)